MVIFRDFGLYIPNTVKCLYDRWGTGGYRNGDLGWSNRDENGKIKCVYLPESLDTLWVIQLNYGAKVDIHIKAKTPPRIENGSFNPNTIVYVPVGYKEVYSANQCSWKNATILEEVYAEQMEINAPELLYVGDSQKLKVEFTPYNVSFKDAIWCVSDSETLSLTQDGTCTALSYGTVQVTATNADRSCTDTKTIKVYEHTTGVNISKSALKLTVGEKTTLIANTLPIGNSDELVTWSSNDALVATVDEKGNVKGTGRGTCTITATSVDGGYTATCEVTVTQPVEALTLEKHSISLKVGESEKVFAQINPATADNKTIVWVSSNEEIASVNADGTINALKGGEAWIKAVSQDNVEAKDSCKVTVTQPVTGVALSKESVLMNNVGKSVQLNAVLEPADATNKAVRWSSTNTAVCTVANGYVVATGYGTAVVLASTVDGGFMAACTVTVEKDEFPVTVVELSQSSVTIIKDNTIQLQATVLPEEARYKTVVWTSGNPAVAEVNDRGEVTGKKYGTAIITATSSSKPSIKAECLVTVVGELVDGSIYNNTDRENTVTFFYTRTFNDTNWQALYVPFSMSYADWMDDFEVAEINNFHEYDFDEDGTSDWIILEVLYVKSGSIMPNTPYLIRAKETGTKTITLDDATLYPAEENSIDCSSVKTKYTFTGTYTGVSGYEMYRNGYYVLSGNVLNRQASSSPSLSSFRWYLKPESRSGNSASTPRQIRINVVDINDPATEIADVKPEGDTTIEYYNINGVKIEKPNAPGIYIVRQADCRMKKIIKK